MDFFTGPVIASLFTFTGTMIVACISIYNNKKTTKENRRLIERTDLIEKRKTIEKKLNEFYIPLRHHLEQSKTLFKIFSIDKPEKFKTLTHLLNPHKEYGDQKIIVKLNRNDKALLQTIIDIGNRIENLIHEKSYLIGEDVEFVNTYQPSQNYANDIEYSKDLTLLSLLISHIVTIRMAYNRQILGQVEKFEGFVFPNEINPKVNQKITELEYQIRDFESRIQQLIK